MPTNVLVQKTVPLFFTPDQNMYPGAAPSLWAHEFHFTGTEGYLYAQIWVQDVITGAYRQATTEGILTNGAMIIPYWAVAVVNGNMVLQLTNTNDPGGFNTFTSSNAFTYRIDTVEINGDSINLGTAPCPPNCTTILKPVAPVIPIAIPKKHGNH